MPLGENGELLQQAAQQQQKHQHGGILCKSKQMSTFLLKIQRRKKK